MGIAAAQSDTSISLLMEKNPEPDKKLEIQFGVPL